MRTSVHTTTKVYLYLDPHETYDLTYTEGYGRKSREITVIVDTIYTSLSDDEPVETVSLFGALRKMDGQPGLVNKSTRVHLQDLREDHREALLAAANNSKALHARLDVS